MRNKRVNYSLNSKSHTTWKLVKILCVKSRDNLTDYNTHTFVNLCNFSKITFCYLRLVVLQETSGWVPTEVIFKLIT